MNYSNPIVICDENEEFRILLREMLTKNGFFHIVEAANGKEMQDILRERKKFFVITHSKMLSSEMIEELPHQKNFLILADNEDPKTLLLAARLGINHILNFPIHSRKLMEKLASIF